MDTALPIFDKLLLKRKVLSHSVRSAVAAIISRNHSHHIGSFHVSPRATVEKICERLESLGVLPAPIGRPNQRTGNAKQPQTADEQVRFYKLRHEIVSRLKSRLDTYIQKKADFSAEIATEPIISTKSVSFFSQVILPFAANSLLMDNLGANEGVRFVTHNDSRLRFRMLVEGTETEAWFGIQGGACSCQQVSHQHHSYSGNCSCLKSNLQLVSPYPQDRMVALPGPLGEFAVYSALENMIRNSVKHNRSWFQQDHTRRLDIFINLSEVEDNTSLTVDPFTVGNLGPCDFTKQNRPFEEVRPAFPN